MRIYSNLMKSDDKFAIDKSTGDFTMNDKLNKQGFATVTEQQAKDLHPHGWHFFGKVLGRPGYVTVQRVSGLTHCPNGCPDNG